MTHPPLSKSSNVDWSIQPSRRADVTFKASHWLDAYFFRNRMTSRDFVCVPEVRECMTKFLNVPFRKLVVLDPRVAIHIFNRPQMYSLLLGAATGSCGGGVSRGTYDRDVAEYLYPFLG